MTRRWTNYQDAIAQWEALVPTLKAPWKEELDGKYPTLLFETRPDYAVISISRVAEFRVYMNVRSFFEPWEGEFPTLQEAIAEVEKELELEPTNLKE